jgi:hypothetical protein
MLALISLVIVWTGTAWDFTNSDMVDVSYAWCQCGISIDFSIAHRLSKTALRNKSGMAISK